jgi:uncharacterized protein
MLLVETAFNTTDANQQFWKKYYCIQIFIYTIICIKTHTVDVIGRVTLSNKLTIIFVLVKRAFIKFSFQDFIVSKGSVNKVFSKLIPWKMSLTKYINP